MSAKPFRNLLRSYRLRAGLSQSRLAELADIDHSHVSRLESGNRFPSFSLICDLGRVLGLSADETAQLCASAGFLAPGHAPSITDPDLLLAARALADPQAPDWWREWFRYQIRNAVATRTALRAEAA